MDLDSNDSLAAPNGSAGAKMEQEKLLSSSENLLALVLGFFPRADAKNSVVLAVDTAMVGYLAAHIPPLNSLTPWECVGPVLTFVLQGISIWHLYKGAFPTLEGGGGSFVYFREIAKKTEAKFIDEFTQQSEGAYVRDVLGQAWRNSEILSEKFEHLKTAFAMLACAVVPWAFSLLHFAMRSQAAQRNPHGKERQLDLQRLHMSNARYRAQQEKGDHVWQNNCYR